MKVGCPCYDSLSMMSLPSRFCTGQDTCKACLTKWGLISSDLCDCGELHTMSHIIDSCPNTRLTGGISALHNADNICIDWLTTYGMCIRQQQQYTLCML